ncbi:MAG: hypothetical protein J5736_01265 [Bacilli bacterium]|nr:hypothetical protein [Bacilli bacterium]
MKGKRRFLATLGLLLAIPCLISAKRDHYSPYTSEYRDFHISVEQKAVLPEEGMATYEFTLENTGTGFISILRYEKERLFDGVFVESPFRGSPELMKPGRGYRWEMDFAITEFDAGNFIATALIDSNSFDLPADTAIRKIEGTDYYSVDFTIPGMEDTYTYSYEFALTLEYEGIERCLRSGINEEKNPVFSIRNENFDVTKAVVKSLDVFEYENYHTNYFGYAMGGALYILLQMAGVFLIASVVVAVLIVTIVIIKKKKRRKRTE